MRITIELDTKDASDLAGLTALIAVIGGADALEHVAPAAAFTNIVVPAPPAPHPMATSEQLIAQEVRRAAGEAGGNTDGGEVSPAASSTPVEYDTQGVPYDERIHTSGDTKTNADGSWRKRRGVNDETVAAVIADLTARGLMRAPTAPLAPTPPVAPAPEPVSAPPAPAAPVQTVAPPAPQPTPEPAATASGPAPAAPVADSNGSRFTGFPDFVSKCSSASNPSPTYERLNAVANGLGVAKYADMKDQPQLWNLFFDTLIGG